MGNKKYSKKCSYYINNILIVVLSLFFVFTNINPSFAYPITFNNEIDYIKSTIKNNYLYDFNNEILNSNNFKKIFEELDHYSVYYTKDELTKLMQDFNNEIVGIGVYIQKDENNQIYINKVIENSPSYKKISIGDIITEIDGRKTNNLSLDDAANLIRGKVGTMVNLKLKNLQTSIIKSINIKREKIKIESLNYKIIEKNIGYIQINIFNQNISKDFQESLNYFKNKNIDKLIIDLRGNGGGYLDETVKISKMLISNHPIVHVKNKYYMKSYYSFLEKSPFEKDNLIVLIDENSASASEILAAAIKDTKSGILVGKKSYGKGTVQKLYSLPSGAGFKITEAIYLTANKNEIEGKGINPDYEVDLSNYIDNIQEDKQLSLALKLLSENKK